MQSLSFHRHERASARVRSSCAPRFAWRPGNVNRSLLTIKRTIGNQVMETRGILVEWADGGWMATERALTAFLEDRVNARGLKRGFGGGCSGLRFEDSGRGHADPPYRSARGRDLNAECSKRQSSQAKKKELAKKKRTSRC